ncbi:hypothetical protein FDP41_008864 [Naegleria fowleri]|uniref:DUF4116 domain-containing protein n=1 Tax=Naegleria fowleri TaxID=5763 RepID=A0A6A5BEZ1_NAEFO|nr:uncharacterized protein FDP41_008864 [Naegleria fowleri]KAF0972615.1 hypothetical protein FDP41_008864 [Naegleria fowleri]
MSFISGSQNFKHSHILQLCEWMKFKFENQMKGFAKWLLAKEKWLKYGNPYQFPIEFLNDRDIVKKMMVDCTIRNGYFSLIHPWMAQEIDIAELCKSNRELIGNVEFWLPFKYGILKFILNKDLRGLKYIPKDILLELKDELIPIVEKIYNFSFSFDPDDVDDAKKALYKKCYELQQLSKRLRDNEEIVKYAIECNAKNTIECDRKPIIIFNYEIIYMSERLKYDITFCMDIIRLDPQLMPHLPIRNDKEFLFQLLDIPISINRKLQQDMIQKCVPEILQYLSYEFIYEFPEKMRYIIFQQFFLKDANCWHFCKAIHVPFDVIMSHHLLQIFLELPEEYYEAYQQIMIRLYSNYDPQWLGVEESILKRKDLPLILQYAPIYHLRNDKNFVLKAVKANANCFKFILHKFRYDREIVSTILLKNACLLFEKNKKTNPLIPQQYLVPQKFLQDKEVILAALKSEHPCSFSVIPKNFQEDKDCLLEALRNRKIDIDNQNNKPLVDILAKYVERKDREVIIVAWKNYKIGNIPEDLKCFEDVNNKNRLVNLEEQMGL